MSTDTRRWTIDPSRSTIEFEVPAFRPPRSVKGRFRRFEGFYDHAGSAAVMELTIDAASIDTGDRSRDRRLRSERFFDVAEHPKLTFVSTLIENGDETVAIVGRLRARGLACPVAFEAEIQQDGEELEIDAETEVDLRELGIAPGPGGMLRPDATLHVVTRLRPES